MCQHLELALPEQEGVGEHDEAGDEVGEEHHPAAVPAVDQGAGERGDDDAGQAGENDGQGVLGDGAACAPAPRRRARTRSGPSRSATRAARSIWCRRSSGLALACCPTCALLARAPPGSCQVDPVRTPCSSGTGTSARKPAGSPGIAHQLLDGLPPVQVLAVIPLEVRIPSWTWPPTMNGAIRRVDLSCG